MTRPSRLAATILAVGLALVIASYLWPLAAPPRTAWSDGQAEQLRDAGIEYHRLQGSSHHHGHNGNNGNNGAGGTSRAASELDQAKQRYLSLKAELDGARARPRIIALVLFWLGLAGMASGGAMAARLPQRLLSRRSLQAASKRSRN